MNEKVSNLVLFGPFRQLVTSVYEVHGKQGRIHKVWLGGE